MTFPQNMREKSLTVKIYNVRNETL